MKIPLILVLVFLHFAPGVNEFRLTVSVSGLKPLEGDLYIALHNRPEYFQEPDSAFMKMKVEVKKETELVKFENVPAGDYAIAVYHDENLDGKLDMNNLGLPKEGYGYSTKNKVAGRAKFDQAAFAVSGNDTVEVKMIYLAGTGPK